MDWNALVEGNYGSWQLLGPDALSDQLWESLAYLHTQPPGLNALMGLDLAATPDSHFLLALVFASMGVATVFFVVDALSLVGVGSRWATGTGVAFALLPSSVIYMLWPFTTGPTMFACALALWGVALARQSLLAGVGASVAGAGLLFLFRASFLWVFVLVWIGCLGVLVWKSAESRRQIGLGLGILLSGGVAVMLIQAHYVTSFGIWSTSSWGGRRKFDQGNGGVWSAAHDTLRCRGLEKDWFLRGRSRRVNCGW